MKALIAITCVVVIAGVAYFVYQDQAAKSAAAAAQEEQQFYRTCQKTRPGGEYESLTEVNAECRRRGYI